MQSIESYCVAFERVLNDAHSKRGLNWLYESSDLENIMAAFHFAPALIGHASYSAVARVARMARVYSALRMRRLLLLPAEAEQGPFQLQLAFGKRPVSIHQLLALHAKVKEAFELFKRYFDDNGYDYECVREGDRHLLRPIGNSDAAYAIRVTDEGEISPHHFYQYVAYSSPGCFLNSMEALTQCDNIAA